MAKILVSIISYGEKDLRSTVLHCYENSSNKENLFFSIVDEQPATDDFSSFPEIPESQILYRTYDTSEYRGILWARDLTTQVPVDYRFVLYICGHTRFAPGWDAIAARELHKAKKKSATGKAVLTYCQADFSVTETSNFDTINTYNGRNKNVFHQPGCLSSLIPGYGFPGAAWVPEGEEVHEGCWLHFTWAFAEKSFVDEVPLRPDINFHAEEPYMTVLAWCRGWRFFATPKLTSWHQMHKKYPDEKHVRIATHRPWADKNKDAFWANSNHSVKQLNELLSGRVSGKYGDVEKKKVLEFCSFSGLDRKWTQYDPNYDALNALRHGHELRFSPIIPYEKTIG